MEVHKILGKGHNEIIYKDALEHEFGLRGISFSREHPFEISYKGIVLPRKYYADFIVFDKIILGAKAIECLHPANTKQTLNYLAASKLKVGLLVNFGEESLIYNRIVL